MQRSLTLLFACFIAFSISAQHDLSPKVIENIEQRIATGANPSIAVGIIDTSGMYFYSFGTKTLNGDPVDEHSIYEIGSITKTFTGILLAELTIEGLVSPDDPANKYMPENAQLPERNGEQITLGNLSDHTSSLPRMPSNFTPADPSNPYQDYTIAQMYEFLGSVELTRDIGSQYEYSNLAQGLLGQILADVAGKSYEELVMEKILTPLKMSESAITLSSSMKAHLAYGHSGGQQVSNWDIPALAGAGAIRSSTSDMLKYLGANLGIIDSELADAMGMSHYARHDKAGGEYVGLGWHIKPNDDGDIVWHNGGTGGYRAFSGFIKEKEFGVVVLTNSDESVDDLGIYLLDNTGILRDVKPMAATEIRKAIDTDGSDAGMARYVELKEGNASEYDFEENGINSLGYSYLQEERVQDALVVFKINIKEHPESFNVYDSYAEALLVNGENDAAIENYKKSVDINPGNTNGINMLRELGVEYGNTDFKVSEETLEKYVGVYQLAPGFNLTITRDGSQLFGQATGQGQFELFATSETEFYLKVTPAQVHFTMDENGDTASLTLFQAGQEMVGKKTD